MNSKLVQFSLHLFILRFYVKKKKKASFPALEWTLVLPKLSLGSFPSHLPSTTVVDYGGKGLIQESSLQLTYLHICALGLLLSL